MNENKQRAIITVVGHDAVGIIARVCTYLADNNINILDISQTIVNGYFNMMMIADLSGKKKHFAEVSSELDDLGKEIGVMIKIQKEEIFELIHRV